MKKLLISSAVIALIVPQITLAAWWNPVSWFRKQPAKNAIQESSVKTATSTATEIEDLQKRIDALKKQQAVVAPASSVATKKKIEKVVPYTNSSETTKVQVQMQVEIAAKAKADEQARIDMANDMLQKQIIQQAEANRVQAINAQIEADKKAKADQVALVLVQQQAEQFVAQQALQIKQEKLNAINKQIADLNAKYVADVKISRDRMAPMFAIDGEIRELTIRYNLDYATLTAEFQQIQYSN